MTTEQIDELEAGPEMDLAVAEACGISIWNKYGDGRGFAQRHFSTDWNDAMYAAERFGLWAGGYSGDRRWGGRFLQPPVSGRHEWSVGEWAEHCQQTAEWHSLAPTGPLAICRAILKLHAGGGR